MPRRAAPTSPPDLPVPPVPPASTYPDELFSPSRRVSPGAYATTRMDRRRAVPFLVAGCAIAVLAAGLWFVVGRGHSKSSAPPIVATRTKAPRATTTPHPSAAQRAQAAHAAQSDLRNAFTAEKVAYTDQEAYVASPAAMRAIEPSVAWGTRMHFTVGDAESRGDRGIVCLSETTRYGDTYSLADVALGTAAGTYLGRKPCPARLTTQSMVGFGSRLGP